MKEIFSKNIKYLRKKSGKSQSDIGLQLNKAHTSIGNWEKGISEPSLSEIEQIARIFEITILELLTLDLENVHLNQKPEEIKNGENVHLNVHPNVHLNAPKQQKGPPIEGPLNTAYIAAKDEIISTKDELITSLKAQIELLQNQLDQMKYDTNERQQSQYTPRKERKSA